MSVSHFLLPLLRTKVSEAWRDKKKTTYQRRLFKYLITLCQTYITLDSSYFKEQKNLFFSMCEYFLQSLSLLFGQGPPKWPSGSVLKAGRREVPGSMRGRACRLNVSRFTCFSPKLTYYGLGYPRKTPSRSTLPSPQAQVPHANNWP